MSLIVVVQNATHLPNGPETMIVAVKCLSGTTTNVSRKGFLQEMEIMKILSTIPNRHVVALLGQVTQYDPLLLLTEYMPNGNLRDYLYDARKGINDRVPLSLDQLCLISLGVARGMEHLAQKRILHR
jgi:serine/threonine protein kinase